jgi:hypothetical protein
MTDNQRHVQAEPLEKDEMEILGFISSSINS